MSDKFQDRFRIPSARAQWWNYGWNATYFVTICTAHHEHFLGEINNGNNENQPFMQLSEIGILAEKFWLSIPEHFPFVKLDVFVVMPNHIHGILMIDKPNDGCDKNGINLDTEQHTEKGQCLETGLHVEKGQHVKTGQCPVSTTGHHRSPPQQLINYKIL